MKTERITHPRKPLPEHLGASLYAIACILSYDGMAGISLPLEPVDSLATMVSAADISRENHNNHYPKSTLMHQNSASNYQRGNARSYEVPSDRLGYYPQPSSNVSRGN
ncbi:hypothetical protein RD792_006903, partial [Penstemon davidsonii]